MSTNAPPAPTFLPPGAGERLSVVGESIRILADGPATRGSVLIFEEVSKAGMGPPLHRHAHDDECFYILSGRYKFICDGKEFIADPGAFVRCPRGSTHTFASCTPDGGESKMLIICTPPGLEKPFRAVHNAGANASMEVVTAAFAEFQVIFHGPPLKI